MADVKISQLTALASANADVAGDVLAIVDTSVPQTKKITIENLVAPITLDKSNARIGIGESSPGSPLDVKSGEAANTANFNSTSGATNITLESSGSLIGQMEFVSSGTSAIVTRTSASLALGSNNVRTLYITDDDRIGIGTASPKEKLEVEGDIANWRLYSRTGVINGALSFNSYYNGSAWVHDDDSKVSMNMYMSDSRDNLEFSVRAGGTSAGEGSTQMVISSEGNVGIGTGTPNISQYGSTVNVLSVVNESSAGNYGAIEIAGYRTNDGQVGDLNFLNTDGSDGEQSRGLIRAYRDGANDALGFQFFVKATGESTTEKMRIRSDGVAQFRDGIRFLATNGSEPTGDEHHDVAIKIGIYKKACDSTDISQGYIDIDHGIYRDNVLGVEAGIFDSNLNVFKPGFANGDGWLREMTIFASGGTIRVYFGGSVAIGDIVKLVIFYTGSTG